MDDKINIQINKIKKQYKFDIRRIFNKKLFGRTNDKSIIKAVVKLFNRDIIDAHYLESTSYLHCIGMYYKKKIKNYDLMKKFLIKSGSPKSLFELGYYYETIEKNYKMMLFYYHQRMQHRNKYLTLIRLKNYFSKIETLTLTMLFDIMNFNIYDSRINIKFINDDKNTYKVDALYRFFLKKFKKDINIINLIVCK
jgi:hypothetical protein